ncbi:hypothetical protein HK096_004200 [Nowakowskiella sp. JEL0078]|nr:hypothetical protein HK096_004200 [Nowakowskiella sp. JEL0078]
MKTFLLILALAFCTNVDASYIKRQTCTSVYGQCGGIGFTGSTCCTAGNTCVVLNPYYSQCVPGTVTTTTVTSAPGTSSSKTTTTATSIKQSTTTTTSKSVTTTTTTTTTTPAKSSSSSSAQTTSTKTTTTIVVGTTSTTTFPTSTHTQAPYPAQNATTCGTGGTAWVLQDNVCCPAYCSNLSSSEDCSGCGGIGATNCVSPPSKMCKSGTMYPEVHAITGSETFHYSRSTHFGLTSGGACGFGLYGLCTKSFNWTDATVAAQCSAFCTAYPTLCQDPTGSTLRGNFAAPNGDYYTQFWSSLPGDYDNYLSCGECFELIRTKPDGTDYAVGETGYTTPVYLEIVDSCPCSANSKWCCGSGADHCAEVSNFKYGCPLPADSIHLDLSDIAMARLQSGNANGGIIDGVIPTRYKRVSCPKPGNVYLYLRNGGGQYYFAMTVVNAAGIGGVVNIEIQGTGTTTWTSLVRDPNYTSSRPQERYGTWRIPQGTGPFNLPIAMKITSATGEVIVNNAAITTFTPPATADPNFWYIDFGSNFSK